MSENHEPQFIEKRFFWGLCYGMLDPKRMAAVILRPKEGEAGKELRDRVVYQLSLVKDGELSMDGHAHELRNLMETWGIPG